MKTNKSLFGPIFWALTAFVLGVVFAGTFRPWASAPIAQGQHRVLYQCPMHPDIIQDHPGFCPICHMRLEKVDDDGRSAAGVPAPATQGKILRYRNPMDPTIFSDHAMKDSMGMAYIPVYADQDDDDAGGVAGKAGFALSPERQQLIGVRTIAAGIQPITLTLRLPGRGAQGGRVLAQLLEIDGDSLRVGMKAHLLGPDGRTAEARVIGVDGTVDDLTHSFGVTLKTSGPVPWLRPGLFCEVLVDAAQGSHLAVPQEAVLDTGARQVVFVEDRPGHFDPRPVVLGEAGDELVEIKQGVRPGEQVVTSANFLIDSESRFRAALQQF